MDYVPYVDYDSDGSTASGQSTPRRIALSGLVDSIVARLQHGCGHTLCRAPLCWTARSSVAAEPLRKYTRSSAMAIAIALVASPQDLEALVCSHNCAVIDHTDAVAASERIDPKSLTQQLVSTAAMRRMTPKVRYANPFKVDLYKLMNVVRLAQTVEQADFVAMLQGPIREACQRSWRPTIVDGDRRRAFCTILVQALYSRHLDESSSASLQSRSLNSIHDFIVDNRLAPHWIAVLLSVVMRTWSAITFIQADDSSTPALCLLELFHRKLDHGPDLEFFADPRIIANIKLDEACSTWMQHVPVPGTRHILSYTMLLDSRTQIQAFRRCCYHKMRTTVVQVASALKRRYKTMSYLMDLGLVVNEDYLSRRMMVAMRHYLILQIRRGHLLEDAFDQVWQREERELERPLRVRLGSDFGEIGHDLGGVQIEFFNLLCAEMCDSRRSIFVTDPTTHLSWFRIGSFEPLHRYELFGVLFGLAVYNGIPLPVSFPLAFYAKLMGHTVADRKYLADGWPQLHTGLGKLLTYDGDVENDLALSFDVQVDVNGLCWYADLLSYEWAASKATGVYESSVRAYASSTEGSNLSEGPSSEGVTVESHPVADDVAWPGWTLHQQAHLSNAPVTKENREDYVQRYVAWVLDHSIRPQFYAFARGFHRAVDIKALRLMFPQTFQHMVEGSREFSAETLKGFTTYDGVDETSQCIQWFWAIVETYSQEKLRLLLEFVTASSRMPADNTSTLKFNISTTTGEGNDLPRSSTCFGTLHLPEYPDKATMAAKLDIALEHSLGFGQA